METLYHYCSSSAFASILNRNTIWLSSLSLSNDYMEGKFVTQTFERLLAQSKIDNEERDEIRKAIKMAEELFDGLGFCLSQEPDLLSQWRGYADDGKGFSIGFSRQYLEALSKAREPNIYGFRVYKVIYDSKEHENALRPTYEKIKELLDKGSLKMPRFGLLSAHDEETIQARNNEYAESIRTLYHKALMTFSVVYTLKSDAFEEEAEWRLITYLSRGFDDSANYRAAGNRLIPYRETELKDLNLKKITDVYIGPKNITPVHVVEKFMKQCGHPDVKVHQSSASYR